MRVSRPAPRIDISFVIYYPFQFFFYKDIYKALAHRAEFVIDLCHSFSASEQDDLVKTISALIDSIKAPYRIIYPIDYKFPEYLDIFFKDIKCLVSTWEKGCVVHPAARHTKKVRCAYGLGKELTMVRPSGTIYDLTLAHGQRDFANFSLLCPAEIVGLPKFDDWFNDKVGDLPKEIIDKLDKNKSTILYLPTHGDLCSIDLIASNLIELTKIYNVIAKLHYATARVEKNRRFLLEKSNCITVDDSIDILSLFKISNIVISDNSSAVFEAMLADVPVVVADLLPEGYLTGTHQEQRRQFGGAQMALSYPDSLEQVIKRDGSVVIFSKPQNLAKAVAEALNDSPHFKKRRHELSSLFTFRDGKSGERAAHAIEKLLSTDESSVKPILYYALAGYGHDQNDPETKHLRIEKGNEYLSLSKQKLITVNIFYIDDKEATLEQRKESLLSVYTQKNLTNWNIKLEIYSSDTDLIKSWIEDWQTHSIKPPKVTIFDANKKQIQFVLQNFFRSADTFVALTHTSCIYDQDWIITVISLYEVFPEVGAISSGKYTKLIFSCESYYQVPPGILFNTLFRAKFLLGVTINSFHPVAFEAGIKANLLSQSKWLLYRDLVTNSGEIMIDWFVVGQSEALVKVKWWLGIKRLYKYCYKKKGISCLLYTKGFIFSKYFSVYKKAR